MIRTGEESRVSSTDVHPGDQEMTIEVRVYRDGGLVHRELCGSMEQAWLVIDDWAEMGGVSCEVGDMLVRRTGEE
jgi:hypothetical protein